jgi:hypothetical protein
MTRSTKLFFTTVVLALALSGLQATDAQIFSTLHDLKTNNEQLATDIANYLNNIIANMIQPHTPLKDLLRNFEFYDHTIKSSKSAYESEDAASKAVSEAFKKAFFEQATNLHESNFPGFIAECEKIFRKYSVGLYAANTNTSESFFKNSKISIIIKKEITALFDNFKNQLGKNSQVTTKITERVQTNLKVSADYKNKLIDYTNFKNDPIKVLIDASIKLIDGTNEKAADLEDLHDPLNDRVFEYVKATALIGKNKNKPWIPAVLELVYKLIDHVKSKNNAHAWNVKLIRRILDLLKENGHQADAMDIIQDFLKETQPVEEPVEVDIHKNNGFADSLHPSKIQDDGIEEEHIDIQEEEEIINPQNTIEEPVIEQEEPIIKNEEPINQEEEPVNQEEEPINQGEEPINEEEEPINEEEEPINEEEEPINEEEEPVIEEQEPVHEEVINTQDVIEDSSEIIEHPVEEDPINVVDVVEPVVDNKIAPEGRAENLVNVVVGSLTEKQMDIMKISPDVIGVIQDKKIEIDENGDEVEYVYVSIIRSDSPCYDDAIRHMQE